MNNYITLLYGFNNYYNRKIIYFSDVTTYINRSIASTTTDFTVNFDYNDNVNTELVFNVAPEAEERPDYCLVQHLDEQNNIVIDSRWFVIKTYKTRGGQYRLILKRDLIAENFNSLIYAPVFVERAVLPESDEMICNDEGMIFNRIKKQEELLKGKSEVAWIVGYVDKSATLTDVQVQDPYASFESTSLSTIASEMGTTEAILAGLLNFDGANDQITRFLNGNMAIYFGSHERNTDIPYEADPTFYKNGIIISNDLLTSYTFQKDRIGNWTDPLFTYQGFEGYFTMGPNPAQILSAYKNNMRADIAELINQNYFFTQEQLTILQSYTNKIISYNSKYYTLRLTVNRTTFKNPDFKYGDNADFDATIDTYFARGVNMVKHVTSPIYLEYNEDEVYISANELTQGLITIPLSNSRNKASGAVYDVFAIPFGSLAYFTTTPTAGMFNTTNDEKLLFSIAGALATQLGSKLYDIQLLPYCPIENILTPTGGESSRTYYPTQSHTESEEFNFIKNANNEIQSLIFWLSDVNATFTINKQISTDNLKLNSQANLLRLCSPNYQSAFEFNLARNGGSVSYFRIDMTMKPFNPYIRVCPQFSFLYGANYGDNRGLILNGDFSLPRVDDAWIQYELQNKNYQNIFNRDIENLEFNQRQEAIYEKFDAVVGSIQGGVNGAVGGFMSTGSPYGAIAGGVIGLGAGIAGGAMDVAFGEARRNETRQYQIDRYRYTLGNIRALPRTISKVGTFTINNKVFPFIEYYEATAKEVEALENKILYNGMSVERIGTIAEFMGGVDNLKYFQGRLIRFDDFIGDSYALNEISQELMKGVYI